MLASPSLRCMAPGQGNASTIWEKRYREQERNQLTGRRRRRGGAPPRGGCSRKACGKLEHGGQACFHPAYEDPRVGGCEPTELGGRSDRVALQEQLDQLLLGLAHVPHELVNLFHILDRLRRAVGGLGARVLFVGEPVPQFQVLPHLSPCPSNLPLKDSHRQGGELLLVGDVVLPLAEAD